MTSDKKALRRAERSAVGYLKHLRPDRPFNVEPNRWSIRSAAARLASVCAATGESLEEICNRLAIAERHRKALLAIPGAGADKLRELRTKGYSPAAALTLEDKVISRNEKAALSYLRHLNFGRPLDTAGNRYSLQCAAGRIASVCETTGQSFAKVCGRLHISELNKNALLNIPGNGSERLRRVHNGRWARRYTGRVPAVVNQFALLRLLNAVIPGCPPDVEPNKSRYRRAADKLAKVCAATDQNFFETCDWLEISEVDRLVLLEIPDAGRGAQPPR